MSQSQDRARGGRPTGGVPASFGRNVEQPQPGAEDFTIRGGEAFHLVLHVQAIPDPASLEELRAAIRETTRAGVLEGYAAAFAEMDAPEPDPTDGAAPPP